MKITADEVKYVAKLARLNLSPKEVNATTEQLDRILTYVDKLNELETEGVEPTTHALSIQNAFREDEVKKSLDQKNALANGPLKNDDAFVVPKVI